MHTETREFAVHKNILVSVIQSQAGSLGAALMEGVTNSIDAGATRLSIKLDNEGFTLKDDGRGFQSKDEILNWFETFGTPHEQGDAVYGRFRMGRGMMMSFAATQWRTGTFRMEVDLRGDIKLGYTLTEGVAPVKGCNITGTLYDKLSSSSLDDVVRDLTDRARFAQIPVVLNGKLLSKLPAEQKWDTETDDAYIKTTRTGDLLVYNLGVLVKSYPNYSFGCGGIVVSKRQLAVNFARNDILTHSCTVWPRITDHLRKVNLSKIAKKGSLTKEEREFVARQWTYNQLPSHWEVAINHLKLFTDATGRHRSLNELLNCETITVVEGTLGKIGSRIHREGKAFVLSEETLSRFRVDSLSALFDVIEERTHQRLHHRETKLESLALGCSDTYRVLDDSELTLAEQCMLTALRSKHEKFFQWFSVGEKSSGMRELRAGQSDVALAWTDGSTYVVLTQKELAKAAARGLQGCLELLLTLTHEYCHDDAADLESHEHDQVFLNKHHDLVQYRGGKLLQLAQELFTQFQRLAKRGGVEIQKVSRARSPQVGRLDDLPIAAKAQLSLFE